jgi:shikimate dehydrogenase
LAKYKLALLGRSISHSKSPELYQSLLSGNVEYSLLDYSEEKEIPSLKNMFNKNNIQGLNITAPYKKYFLKDVEFEDKSISSLKAINAICFRDGRFIASNTDYIALKKILEKIIKSFGPFEEYILLGNGAMANLSNLLFEELGIGPLVQYYRQKDGALEEINSSPDKKSLLINSCGRSFFYKGSLGKGSVLWDYNYSTKMAEYYNELKVPIYIDGTELLQIQGKEALKFFRIPF